MEEHGILVGEGSRYDLAASPKAGDKPRGDCLSRGGQSERQTGFFKSGVSVLRRIIVLTACVP